LLTRKSAFDVTVDANKKKVFALIFSSSSSSDSAPIFVFHRMQYNSHLHLWHLLVTGTMHTQNFIECVDDVNMKKKQKKICWKKI
jgi:hypothetical protein